MGLIESLEAVAKHGGIRRAAEARRVSKATISRHLATLEEGLHVKLLERSTRDIELTREGELLLERFRELKGRWLDVVIEVQSERDEPAGPVRVSAPHMIAMSFLPELVAEIGEKYPKIVVDLDASDRIVNVLRDADIALRAGPLEPSGLHAVKLFDATEVVVGHPELLEGFQGRAEELAELSWVVHSVKPLGPNRRLTGPGGQVVGIEPKRHVEARTSDAFVALIREGVGVGLVPDAYVHPELERGELVRTEWIGGPAPLYAVFAKRDLAPQRVRVVIEHFRDRLSQRT